MGVNQAIDITAKQREIILSLLQSYLPKTTVWAFGSRVKFTSRPDSDLDIVALIIPEQKSHLSALKEALDESDLPFRVDVLDWNSIPENFKKNIEKEYAVLREAEDGQNIQIPDIRTQQFIASILSSLDDKIELNLQMNQTIETMAQAIFKEWFVNFSFPGFDGRLVEGLPKGWKVVSLENVVELIIGYRGMNPIKLRGDTLHPFDILLTSEGPLGEVAIQVSNINYSLSRRLFAIRANKLCRSSYLYYYLRSEKGKSNIQKRATGSTILGISQSELRKVETLLPSIEVQNMFDEVVSPLLLRIDENFNEIRTLTQIRDSLLPKLMTGKISLDY
jgi:predicted nucleotidyltransferase